MLLIRPTCWQVIGRHAFDQRRVDISQSLHIVSISKMTSNV